MIDINEMADKWVKHNCCECCVNKEECDLGYINCFAKQAFLAGLKADVHTDNSKVIANLEKENSELKEKLKTAYRKGMRHIAKALKDYDRTDGAWTDYFEHTVDKVLQREQLDFEEYGTLAEQLTKAKALLKQFLEAKNGEDTYKAEWEAEHFLKEVEE